MMTMTRTKRMWTRRGISMRTRRKTARMRRMRRRTRRMRTRRTRRRTRRRDEDKIIRRTRMRISRKKKVAGKAVWYCSTVLVLCEPLQKLKNGK